MDILSFKLFIEALIIFQSNLNKNLLLLILPQILKLQYKLKDYDRESYIIFNYTSYFYGSVLGVFFWKFLERFFNKKNTLILSLLCLSIADYITFQTASFEGVQLFQFLRGNAYVHNFVDKSIRDQAFQVESIAQTMGNLLSPFVGEILFVLVKNQAVQFFIILSLALIVSTFSLKFVKHLKVHKKQKPIQEDEIVLMKQTVSMIPEKTVKNILGHCLFDNIKSRKLIYIYIMTSIIFQVDFVLSILLFLSHDEKQQQIFQKCFYISDLFGSLIAIYFVNQGHRLGNQHEDKSIKRFLLYIFYYQFLLLVSTPLVQLLVLYINNIYLKYIIVGLLFFLKIVLNYYIYKQLLVRMINEVVFKIYRSKLNRILIVFKNGGAALFFTYLIPNLYKDSYYDYLFVFLLLAALQLSCSIVLKSIKSVDQIIQFFQKILQYFFLIQNQFIDFSFSKISSFQNFLQQQFLILKIFEFNNMLLKFKLFVQALVCFQINLTQNLLLLVLPYILKLQYKLEDYDKESYMLLNYTSYYNGSVLGVYFWKFIQRYLPKKMTLILSIFLLSVFHALTFCSKDFKQICLIQFLKGFAVNFQQLGNNYVHKYVDKEIRNKAYLVESISQSMGNLLSPLVGKFLFEAVKNSAFQASIIISLSLFIALFSFHFVKAIEKVEELQSDYEINEKTNLMKDNQSVVYQKTYRNVIGHCIIDNLFSRKLIYIYCVSSVVCQVDFVLSVLIFVGHKEDEQNIFNSCFSFSDLIGNLFTIVFIFIGKRLANRQQNLKCFLDSIFYYQFLLLLFTPIIYESIVIIQLEAYKKIIMTLYFLAKISLNYYVYKQLLERLINQIVLKPYRGKLGRLILIIQSGGSGIFFSCLVPALSDKGRYNYQIIFLLLAVLQLSCAITIRKVKEVKFLESLIQSLILKLKFFINKILQQQLFKQLNKFIIKMFLNFRIFKIFYEHVCLNQIIITFVFFWNLQTIKK